MLGLGLKLSEGDDCEFSMKTEEDDESQFFWNIEQEDGYFFIISAWKNDEYKGNVLQGSNLYHDFDDMTEYKVICVAG